MVSRPTPNPRSSAGSPPASRRGRFTRLGRRHMNARPPEGLRLSREAVPATPRPATVPAHQPITAASDPRWVLAIRTAELLEGPVLSHEKRQRLLRLGRLMGLSPFSANLVIAIMQDRARRGRPFAATTADLLANARTDLALVPSTQPRADRRWQTLAAVTALLAMQALMLLWLLR